MPENLTQLTTMTRVLHWLVAAGIIFLTALGIYMEEFEVYSLFDLHISLGALMLLIVIPRIVWRYKEGWPPAAGNYNKLEKISGKIVHWLLLIATALMPISGIIMAIAGGHGLGIFGFELVAEQPVPPGAEDPEMLSPALQQLGESLHGFGGDLLPPLIALHVIGAIKHHVIDKDMTLRRMLGSSTR